MFIKTEDIQTYCPDVDASDLTKIITNVNNLFCSLLPIEQKERTVSFYPHEVFVYGDRNKINTTLLNIQSAKIGGVDAVCKISGKNNSELFFKGDVEFDPIFEISITCGYGEDTIPGDIKDAMIMYAKDQAIMLGNPSNITSYSQGPRKLTFSDRDVMQSVRNVLSRYL